MSSIRSLFFRGGHDRYGANAPHLERWPRRSVMAATVDDRAQGGARTALKNVRLDGAFSKARFRFGARRFSVLRRFRKIRRKPTSLLDWRWPMPLWADIGVLREPQPGATGRLAGWLGRSSWWALPRHVLRTNWEEVLPRVTKVVPPGGRTGATIDFRATYASIN